MESALQRWFEDADGQRVFRRGKHRGRSLDEIAREAPDYLAWMMGADDMDPAVTAVVAEALQRAAASSGVD